MFENSQAEITIHSPIVTREHDYMKVSFKGRTESFNCAHFPDYDKTGEKLTVKVPR